MRRRETYRELILENICYDALSQSSGIDKNRLDELVGLIVDTVCSKRGMIRIAGDDYPADVVRSRFLKLNAEHIEYIFDRMEENTTQIRNIKNIYWQPSIMRLSPWIAITALWSAMTCMAPAHKGPSKRKINRTGRRELPKAPEQIRMFWAAFCVPREIFREPSAVERGENTEIVPINPKKKSGGT